MTNGHSNGHHHSSSSKHKERRKETEEERRIRKEKEKKEGKRPETEEERRIRKEKERKEREERYKKEGKRVETEEERRIRKEKERSKSSSGKRPETEEERKIRKEKERKEREERYKKEGKRMETEEERRIRKEKERSKDHKKRPETEDERRERKERERRERKEREKVKEEVKEEPMEESSAHEEESANDDTMEVDNVKEEPQEDEEDEEEMPIKKSRKRKSYKEESDEDFKAEESEDEKPKKKKKKIKHESEDEYAESEEDFKPKKKAKESKKKAEKAKPAAKSKGSKAVKQEPVSPTKGKKKKEDDTSQVWKWWEEEEHKKDDGTKWKFLEHQGPLFAPLYDPLPDNVRFYYDGKAMRLSEPTEEVATFYGKMLDHDYTTKEAFNKNFFKDWRRVMTEKEKEKIRDLSKCDFQEINVYFKKVSEDRKNRSKEEKKAEKAKNDELTEHYGFCEIDGHKEKIGNFRIEPPGLFRGRGEHPKQGMLKRRVMPEDVIINCSKDSEYPKAPEGHKWKEVRHDNTVTWLASWTENIQNSIKYVMLNPSSKLKGEKDMQKYEKARNLKSRIDKIRADYVTDFKSKEMRIRQRAVALYFIDKLALRAGNEKDEDQADTVGCCSLRVEHISLHPEKNGKEQFIFIFFFLICKINPIQQLTLTKTRPFT